MAGVDNLKIPTSEEARRNGKKGGIASGKARRRKKAMRERLEILLNMPIKAGKIKDIEEIKNFAALEGKNITVEDALMIIQIQKALTGDTTAAAFIRDTSGQKPSNDDWGGMTEEDFESEDLTDD